MRKLALAILAVGALALLAGCAQVRQGGGNKGGGEEGPIRLAVVPKAIGFDFWEQVTPDLVQVVRQAPGVKVENLDPVGNLRDFDWNFQKLWLSPAMQARRKKAHDGCFCTHESNSYYPSLPFNPGHLIQIKKLEKEMKKARRLIDNKEAEPQGVAVGA